MDAINKIITDLTGAINAMLGQIKQLYAGLRSLETKTVEIPPPVEIRVEPQLCLVGRIV